MCIYGSENASPMGRAWHRPCSLPPPAPPCAGRLNHEPKHCHVPSCTRHKLRSRSSVRGGGGMCARDSWREVDGVRGHLPGVIWAAGRCGGVGRGPHTLREWFAIHILLTLRFNRPAMELSRTGWVWVKPDDWWSYNHAFSRSEFEFISFCNQVIRAG